MYQRHKSTILLFMKVSLHMLAFSHLYKYVLWGNWKLNQSHVRVPQTRSDRAVAFAKELNVSGKLFQISSCVSCQESQCHFYCFWYISYQKAKTGLMKENRHINLSYNTKQTKLTSENREQTRVCSKSKQAVVDCHYN